MPVDIKTSDHVFIAGKTGSGKTFLAQKYLMGFKHVAVLDTKGLVNWPEVPGTKWNTHKDREHELLDGGQELTLVDTLTDLNTLETPKVIYRPKWEELTLEHYNEFFKWCYRRKHTTVWIDEVMSVAPNPHKYPEYLKAILTRGRQLHVSCWALTQRPSGIPILVMSEATHVFCFELNMDEDRERLARITGDPTFYNKPGFRNFWYYNTAKSDRAVLARLVEN